MRAVWVGRGVFGTENGMGKLRMEELKTENG
jgi:hypothetical protein